MVTLVKTFVAGWIFLQRYNLQVFATP